jgi:hypothetical protein
VLKKPQTHGIKRTKHLRCFSLKFRCFRRIFFRITGVFTVYHLPNSGMSRCFHTPNSGGSSCFLSQHEQMGMVSGLPSFKMGNTPDKSSLLLIIENFTKWLYRLWWLKGDGFGSWNRTALVGESLATIFCGWPILTKASLRLFRWVRSQGNWCPRVADLNLSPRPSQRSTYAR